MGRRVGGREGRGDSDCAWPLRMNSTAASSPVPRAPGCPLGFAVQTPCLLSMGAWAIDTVLPVVVSCLPQRPADKGAGHSARTVGSAGQPPGFPSRAWARTTGTGGLLPGCPVRPGGATPGTNSDSVPAREIIVSW